MLRAVLEEPLVFAAGIAQGPAFQERQRQRLLAEHILARPNGQQRDRHVPVLGNGHHDGVDVLAGQQVAEIAIAVALVSKGLAGLFAAIGPGIGNGQGHGVLAEERPADVPAAAPQADEAQTDPRVGALRRPCPVRPPR